jgi:uncharacterized protein YcfL
MKIVLSALIAFFLLACSQNEKEAAVESNTTVEANTTTVEENTTVEANTTTVEENTTVEANTTTAN